jgi:hypothetical protein
VIDSWSRKGKGKGQAIDAGVFFFFGSLTKIERNCKSSEKTSNNIIVDHVHFLAEKTSGKERGPNFRCPPQ